MKPILYVQLGPGGIRIHVFVNNEFYERGIARSEISIDVLEEKNEVFVFEALRVETMLWGRLW